MGRRVHLVAVAVCWIVLATLGLGACRGSTGDGQPGGPAGPGVPAAPGGSTDRAGPAPDLDVRVEDGATVAGPFPQIISPTWVSDRKLLVLVRHGDRESIVEISRPGEGAWTGRTLLASGQGSCPPSFYMFDFLGDADSIVFTSASPEHRGLWRFDVRKGSSDLGPAVCRVAEEARLVFRVSPDRTRAVIYDNEGAGLVDFPTGEKARLPGVPAYDFPFTGFGSHWSPDGRRFLYQVVQGQVQTGFGIVDVATRRVVREVFPADGCAFQAAWSPDGSRVAFLALEGNGDAFLGPEDELTPPIGHKLGILEVSSGKIEYLALPGRLTYWTPVWSPTGDAVAFAAGTVTGTRLSDMTVQADIYVAVDSGSQWTISPLTGRQQGGGEKRPLAWSPDGGALTFTSYVRGGEIGYFELGVVRRDDTAAGTRTWSPPVMLGEVADPVWVGPHALVGRAIHKDQSTPGLVRPPCLAPNGEAELIVFGTDGSIRSVLEESGVWYSELSPSPDGLSLAYTVEVPAGPGGEEASGFVLKIRRLPR